MYLCALLAQENWKWYIIRLGFSLYSGYLCGGLKGHGNFPQTSSSVFQRSVVIRMTTVLTAGARWLQILDLLVDKLLPSQ